MPIDTSKVTINSLLLQHCNKRTLHRYKSTIYAWSEVLYGAALN